MPTFQERTLGSWRVIDRLGRGGNATVYAARRSDVDAALALKVISTTRVEREPYRRFVREIAFLREHDTVPGILPLIDSHLPDQPTTADPAWLAMPIATPIDAALSGRPLSDVVAAVAAIADTLFRLQRDFDIAHRDIKPGNLYALDEAWLLGDFGLIAVPNADDLTQDGRQVGPAHYTAYEMILHPTSADPHPADVYGLGKTLWVLATGQAYPPEGHQPVGTRGFEIGDYRPHPHSAALDRLVDLMTRIHPEERPSKEQVARDLIAWQELDAEPVTVDLSAARVRARAKLESEIAKQDALEQNLDLAYGAVRRLQELTRPLNDGLLSVSPRIEIDSAGDQMTQNLLRTHLHMGLTFEVAFFWQRCTKMQPMDGPHSTTLRMSRSLELLSTGVLVLRLMVDVGLDGVSATFFNWESGARSAPAGSIEAETVLEEGVRDLAGALAEGVDVFVEHLPDVGIAD